jgi:hypothetical protein
MDAANLLENLPMPTAEYDFRSCSTCIEELEKHQRSITEYLDHVLARLNGKLTDREQYYFKYIRTQGRKALAIIAAGIRDMQATVHKGEAEVRRKETARAEENIGRDAAGVQRKMHFKNYGPAIAAWGSCGNIYESVIEKIYKRRTRRSKGSNGSNESDR